MPLLIREAPATELAVATRILARSHALAPGGRVAILVGSEVVYIARAGVDPIAMTPYDVAAVHLRDAAELHGDPPADVGGYLEALRLHPHARAVALRSDGSIVSAPSIRECVAALLGRPYEELEAEARLTGQLYGAYPIGEDA